MDMATIGWIALGWFGLALLLSVVIGGFIRKVNETPSENDLAVAASKQKVVRYLRNHKTSKARSSSGTHVNAIDKHAIS